MRIILIGCGALKLDRAALAHELYTGPLFRAAWSWATARRPDLIAIVSAKHGLVMPDQILEPYNFRIDQLTPRERLAWGKRIWWELAAHVPPEPHRVTIVAGHGYVEPLREAVPKGWTLEDPLRGLSLGDRLSWFRDQTPKKARSA